MSKIIEKYFLAYRYFGLTAFVLSPVLAWLYKYVIPSFIDPLILLIPVMAIAFIMVIVSFIKGHRELLQFLILLLLSYITVWMTFLNHLNSGLSYTVAANFIAVIFSFNLLPTMRSVIIYSSIAFPASLLFHNTIPEPQFNKILFNGLILVIFPITVIPQFIRLRLETMLRQAREEILIKNKELLDFTHNVTHDLKKPLAVMKTVCNLVSSEKFNTQDDEGREMMAMGKDAIGYMHELLDDLLATAKLEAGIQTMEYEKIDTRDLFETVLQRFKLHAQEKNIKITKNVSGTIHTDKKGITKVFMNLIGNAVNYIGNPANPEIQISTSFQEKDNNTLITIKDNGLGIPVDVQKDIFRKFKRGTNVEGVSGTGLGLPIVKSIIEAHNGKIWFESREGEGTTFYFTIPEHPTKRSNLTC